MSAAARLLLHERMVESIQPAGTGTTSVKQTMLNSAVYESKVSEAEDTVDKLYRKKSELLQLESILKKHKETERVINADDIDAQLRRLGKPMSKKAILHMLWEVDEKEDQVICFDEMCLTYDRNVKQAQNIREDELKPRKTGAAALIPSKPVEATEPYGFYLLLDFIIFDRTGPPRKGYVSMCEYIFISI